MPPHRTDADPLPLEPHRDGWARGVVLGVLAVLTAAVVLALGWTTSESLARSPADQVVVD